jgi:hypothetical protein
MSNRRIWIGDPYDPEFQWTKKATEARTPRPLADLPHAERLWRALGRHLTSGRLGARRTDDDDWIGLVSRRELEALVDEAFDGKADPAQAELRRSLKQLDAKTFYYLVAAHADGKPGRRS